MNGIKPAGALNRPSDMKAVVFLALFASMGLTACVGAAPSGTPRERVQARWRVH